MYEQSDCQIERRKMEMTKGISEIGFDKINKWRQSCILLCAIHFWKLSLNEKGWHVGTGRSVSCLDMNQEKKKKRNKTITFIGWCNIFTMHSYCCTFLSEPLVKSWAIQLRHLGSSVGKSLFSPIIIYFLYFHILLSCQHDFYSLLQSCHKSWVRYLFLEKTNNQSTYLRERWKILGLTKRE